MESEIKSVSPDKTPSILKTASVTTLNNVIAHQIELTTCKTEDILLSSAEEPVSITPPPKSPSLKRSSLIPSTSLLPHKLFLTQMNDSPVIINHKDKRSTLYALIAMYWAFYFVRSHMAVTLPQMTSATGLTNSEVGFILSGGYVALSIGKLVNGFSLAFIPAKQMLGMGILAAISFSLLYAGVGSTLNERSSRASIMATFIVLWGMIRYSQSIAWGSILNILTVWYHSDERGKAISLFAISYGFGDAFIRLTLGSLSSVITWYQVWFVASACAFTISVLCYTFIRNPLIGEKEGKMKLSNVTIRKNLFTNLKKTVNNRRFLIVAIMYIGLTMIRETFLSWTTLIFAEVFKFSDGVSGILSLIIPFFSAFSSISGGWWHDNRKGRKEVVPVVYLIGLFCALGGLAFIVQFGATETTGIRISGIILLSLVALSIEAPYVLMHGVYAIDIGGEEAPGMTVGVLQAAGNVGGIAAGSLTGYVSEMYGWATWFLVMTIMVIFIIMFAIFNLKMPKQMKSLTADQKPSITE